MKKLVIPQLNAQQYELMTTTEPNILCLASAGSGKTFAATARVEYFIRQHRVDPSDFLIISFSRTAASEMRERLKSSLSKKQFQKLFISTFHAYCRNVVIEQQTTLGIEAHRMKLIDERRLEGLFKVTAKRLLAAIRHPN
jgi:DNA helicase-2/ATP-dependent DNA helicase PcrA